MVGIPGRNGYIELQDLAPNGSRLQTPARALTSGAAETRRSAPARPLTQYESIEAKLHSILDAPAGGHDLPGLGTSIHYLAHRAIELGATPDDAIAKLAKLPSSNNADPVLGKLRDYAKIEGKIAAVFRPKLESDFSEEYRAAIPILATDAIKKGITSASFMQQLHSLSKAGLSESVANHFEAYRGLSDQLHKYFAKRITTENQHEYGMLIADRCKQMLADGDTADSLVKEFTKASRMDTGATLAVGAAKSAPFGLASALLNNAPNLLSGIPSTVGQFAAGAAISAGFDAVGGSLLSRATTDPKWLVPMPERAVSETPAATKLDQAEALMAEAHNQRKPSLMRQVFEYGTAFQAFTVRNVARTAVVPVVTHFAGAEVGKKVDQRMAEFGSPASGAGAYWMLDFFSRRRGADGVCDFLERPDWHERFGELKATTWTKQMQNAGKRVLALPADFATDTLKAGRDVLTAKGVASGATLTAGLIGIDYAQTVAVQAAKEAGLSDAMIALVNGLALTGSMAPVVGAWTTAGVLVNDTTVKIAEDAIHKTFGRPLREHTAGMVPEADNLLDERHRDDEPT